MNRSELVDAVTEQVGDRRLAATTVEAVLDTVTRALVAGERVALSGFGVFERAERAARTARNPATGGTVQVPATAVPRFRAGQALKDAVSGKRELPQQAAPVTGIPARGRRTTAVDASAHAAVEPVAPADAGPSAGGATGRGAGDPGRTPDAAKAERKVKDKAKDKAGRNAKGTAKAERKAKGTAKDTAKAERKAESKSNSGRKAKDKAERKEKPGAKAGKGKSGSTAKGGSTARGVSAPADGSGAER